MDGDKIEQRADDFRRYLIDEVLGNKNKYFLDELAGRTRVFIFSGIIRDFFLDRHKSSRDLDLVLEDIPPDFPDELANDRRILWVMKNKFGGFKFTFNDGLSVDLWKLKDTWGINEENLPVCVESLIQTPFFNFSSIVFDYGKSEFIVGKAFREFLNNHELDVVLSRNFFPESCIISTIHYAREYNLRIGKRLMEWIKDNYDEKTDYSSFQIRRFEKCECTNEEIGSFAKNPEKFLERKISN